MDDDDDDDNENDVHDIPLLDKEHEPLYEVFKTNLIFVVLLIMNLKVMNGLSNMISHMDVNVCNIFHHIYMIALKVIIVRLIKLLLINKSN